MAQSKQVAALLGPSLIVVSVTELLNLEIFTNTSAHLTYLNGTLLFVAGLTIVRAHNYWMPRWPVLITLTGWLLLLGGLIRMVAPVSSQQTAHHPTAVLAMTAVLLVCGVVLTVNGYRQRDVRDS